MKIKSMKKRTLTILSIALVAVLAIGGTLAYLAATTEQYENAFTFAENVKAKLDEPNWDPEEGQDLVPGYEMDKDPMITNMSDNGVDEFVAIRVNFSDILGVKLSDADTARLLELIAIDWNTTDWTLADEEMEGQAEQIWVYNSAITPGEVTNPLFNTVTILTKDEYVAAGGTAANWETEYSWMTGIVMDHTDACYEYPNACDCDVTYKHHVNCALSVANDPEAATTAEGGTTDEGNTCTCHPAEVHEPDCASLEGVLIDEDCHTVANAINGFQAVVKGAVVQSVATEIDTVAEATDKLVELFTANPYVVTPFVPETEADA